MVRAGDQRIEEEKTDFILPRIIGTLPTVVGSDNAGTIFELFVLRGGPQPKRELLGAAAVHMLPVYFQQRLPSDPMVENYRLHSPGACLCRHREKKPALPGIEDFAYVMFRFTSARTREERVHNGIITCIRATFPSAVHGEA